MNVYKYISIYLWNVLGKMLLSLATNISDFTTDATAGTYGATTATTDATTPAWSKEEIPDERLKLDEKHCQCLGPC